MIVRIDSKQAEHFDAMRQTEVGVSKLIDYWTRAALALNNATQADLPRLLPSAACVLRALLPDALDDRWSACERLLEQRIGAPVEIARPGCGHVPTLRLIRGYLEDT